ncbi:MAG: hypothetical protein GQ570_11985 [Helicobacteraceae bacterium]|nr:hypothetical protein [Helicobacteraceae bacterium]
MKYIIISILITLSLNAKSTKVIDATNHTIVLTQNECSFSIVNLPIKRAFMWRLKSYDTAIFKAKSGRASFSFKLHRDKCNNKILNLINRKIVLQSISLHDRTKVDKSELYIVNFKFGR